MASKEKMITIKQVTKKLLQPKFGMAMKDTALIRNDLPRWIKMSVIVHELYHIEDKSTNVLWREIKAIVAQMLMPLLGGIGCIVLSFSPERLKYYYKRIMGEGKNA